MLSRGGGKGTMPPCFQASRAWALFQDLGGPGQAGLGLWRLGANQALVVA